jgi:hypothetical protein
MKILTILSQNRNDFTAILECEHCANTQKLMTGYDDDFYHNKVLPSITCQLCKKDRAGNIPEKPNDEGFKSVTN